MNDELREPESKNLWQDLVRSEAKAPERVVGPEASLCDVCRLMARGIVPGGVRFTLPSGIAHDFMREDIHNKLADDAFKEGRAAGIEQERATHGHDLIFAALVSAFAGFLLAAAMSWLLKNLRF